MPAPSLGERIRVNNQLKKLGFGGVDDPTLMAQFAYFIRTHEQFRGILMAVTPEQRAIAYQQLAPKLHFKAKPLEAYEREVKEKAEREQWDIWDGSAYPKPFKKAEIGRNPLEVRAEQAIIANDTKKRGLLTLECRKCLCEQTVFADSKRDGHETLAALGWQIEGDKALCPNCIL